MFYTTTIQGGSVTLFPPVCSTALRLSAYHLPRLLFLVLGIPVLILGLAVNAYAMNTVTWKEEVALHDGKTLIVTRTHTHDPKGFREIGQPPPLVEATITFTIPGTKQAVTWKSDFGRAFQDSLNLLVLDILNGTPYLAAKPAGCLAYNKWDRPNPPYVFFKYNGEWKQISLEEFPEEIKSANVILSPGSNDNKRKEIQEVTNRVGFVPVAKIKELNKYSQKDSLVLARTPIKTATTVSCSKDVYVGDGWMGLDWFTSKSSYEECVKVCTLNKISPQYCPCGNLFKK